MPRFTVIECQGIGPHFVNNSATVEALTHENAVFIVTGFEGALESRPFGDSANTKVVTDLGQRSGICCFVVEHT